MSNSEGSSADTKLLSVTEMQAMIIQRNTSSKSDALSSGHSSQGSIANKYHKSLAGVITGSTDKIIISTVVASSWLSSFLSKTRSAVVPVAPEICVGNDEYLRMFNSRFTTTSTSTDRFIEPGNNDFVEETLLYSERKNMTGSNNDDNKPQENLSDNDVCGADGVGKEYDNEDQCKDQTQDLSSGKIRLFNLPYSVIESEVNL